MPFFPTFLHFRTNTMQGMVTPLMWKSLDRFHTIFLLMWTCPLEWDPKKQLIVNTFFEPIGLVLKEGRDGWVVILYIYSL